MNEAGYGSSKGSILIVDDTPANLRLLMQLLTKHGYHAYPAPDGESALQFVQATPPDLILLDVLMPGMDGYEVCERLKANERTCDIPVIFISSVNQALDKVKALTSGAVDFITKPLQAEEVLARIETHLALRSLQDHLEQRVQEHAAELIQANARLHDEIAERRRAEAALADERNLLRTLIDSLPDRIYVKDRVGRFVSCNSALARIMGDTTPDELIGKTDFDFFPPELAEQYYADEQALLRSGQSLVNKEETRGDRTGMPRWSLTTKVPLRDHLGQVVGLVGISRDITERMQAEQELRKYRDHLEELVAARTAELTAASEQLQREMAERERAEAALAEERNLLRTLIDNLPDLIYVKDTASRFVLANMASAHTIGLRTGDIVGKTDFDLAPPELAAQHYATEQALLSSGQPLINHEELSINPAGQYRWFLSTKVPLQDSNGTIIGLVGIGRDITDRKRAEEELRQYRDHLEELVAARTAELTAANAHLQREITERKLAADKETRRRMWLERVLALGKTVSQVTDVQTCLLTINESVRSGLEFDRVGLHLYDPNEKVLRGTYGTSRTGEVVDTSWYLQPLVDAPVLQQILSDPKGFLYTPDRSATIQAPPNHEMYGVKEQVTVAAWAGDKPVAMISVDNLISGRPMTEEQIEALRLFAGYVGLAIENARLYAAAEQELAERKRLEAQLRQAQKMEAIGRLAGGIAHDFNNLLTAILGYADLVLAELDAAAELRQEVQAIQTAGERAAALTGQLLAFSRQQVLQPEPLNFNTVVANLSPMLRRLLGEDIELITLLAANLGWVQADPSQIEQVIINLAINARDAMPAGGQLTMETANVELDAAYAHEHLAVAAGSYVLLAVSDTGHGMDADTQARIFEPFFTTKEAGKGTGLGLAMVHGIVSQSGGHIWVYSEIGQGTIFKIYLPQAAEQETTARPRLTSAPVPDGTETILLVEDDALVRTLAHDILHKYRYTVLAASTGVEALQLAQTYPGSIDLVLTDVVMPGGLSGPQLVQHLAAQRPTVKVLYMSGYTDNTIVRHGVLDSGLAFLQKPFTAETLARKVRDVLGRADQEDN